jgi:hypothetical protein
MSTSRNNTLLNNLASLEEHQAKVVWKLGKAAGIISEEVPDVCTGKALRDAVASTEGAIMQLTRHLGATPGQEGVVQALYGRPVKTASKSAALPLRTVAKGTKGRPATGNNSGRYYNGPIPMHCYVKVKVANPKRPGTQAHERFAKYPKKPMTVQQILTIKDGPRLDDLRWDLRQEFIELMEKLPEGETDSTHDTKTASNGVSLAKRA